MKTTIRAAQADDLPLLLDIWRRAALATHDFLDPGDFAEIEAAVAGSYLPRATLWVAEDAAGRPEGFMGTSGRHIDALFVDPDRRGGGLGRALVDHALRTAAAVTVDVNEQNAQAVGFYHHLGFRWTGRSETDGEGRPYPLLHLRKGP